MRFSAVVCSPCCEEGQERLGNCLRSSFFSLSHCTTSHLFRTVVRGFRPGALEIGALAVFPGAIWLAVLLLALLLRRGLLLSADLSLGRRGNCFISSSLCLFHKLARFVFRNSPLCFSLCVWAHPSPPCFPVAPDAGVLGWDERRGGRHCPHVALRPCQLDL